MLKFLPNKLLLKGVIPPAKDADTPPPLKFVASLFLAATAGLSVAF